MFVAVQIVCATDFSTRLQPALRVRNEPMKTNVPKDTAHALTTLRAVWRFDNGRADSVLKMAIKPSAHHVKEPL
jgi:hypothetical protein